MIFTLLLLTRQGLPRPRCLKTGANLGVTTRHRWTNRSVSPDIGADEFNLYPTFAHTALGITCVTGDRTVTADISDRTVAVSLLLTCITGKMPAATSRQQVSLTSGTANSGTWTYTISASALGGLTSGDQVSYYIVAEGSSSM